MDLYEHEKWVVRAKQFTGSNYREVVEFLDKYIGAEANPRFYSGFDTVSGEDRNLIQFYGWYENWELNPGMWVVIHRSDNGRNVEIMCPSEFDISYREVNR